MKWMYPRRRHLFLMLGLAAAAVLIPLSIDRV